MVTIENLHNLRCPTCTARLHAQAARRQPLGRPDPIYVQGDGLRCPEGHDLPALEELYRWRDEHGYTAEPGEIREVD